MDLRSGYYTRVRGYRKYCRSKEFDIDRDLRYSTQIEDIDLSASNIIDFKLYNGNLPERKTGAVNKMHVCCSSEP
jgi:hypothetical protein